MSELVFRYSPSIELLQWLAQGSLKQNLLRAIRLWVWLQSLYGDESSRITLPQIWTYADWKDAFFSSTHPKADQIPSLHDKNCLCAKTIAEWIFKGDMGVEESEWKASLISYCVTPNNQTNFQSQTNLSASENLLIVDSDSQGKKKIKRTVDEILQRCLFAVTRRTLQKDLYILKDMGWIKHDNKKYQLVEEFPKLDFLEKSNNQKVLNTEELTFSNFNLETTIDIFSKPIGGYRRFYLEVDYIIPDNRDDIEDTQNILKEVWNTTPIPPIEFTYESKKLGKPIKLIVYPVCIYYAKRAIYLSAFGETPDNKGKWYNYRLDSVRAIKKLDWSDSTIPEVLLECDSKKLTPEYIRDQLSEAWGYDFYEERKLLVLRFDRSFHDSYIKGTFRHEKFENITYEEAKLTIQNQSLQDKTSIKKFLRKFSENHAYRNDAYYKVFYRDKDVNIIHRLRSWRPNGEVLLPWDLRQKLAEEAIQEVQNYQN